MKTQYYAAASLDGFIATRDHSLEGLFQPAIARLRRARARGGIPLPQDFWHTAAAAAPFFRMLSEATEGISVALRDGGGYLRLGERERARKRPGSERSPDCSADLGIREMECKGPIVHVHELARFDVFGVVDSACADVSDIALVEEDPLSIGEQGARFLAIELDRHLSFNDDRHVVAWV
jgi:hypothetical protein